MFLATLLLCASLSFALDGSQLFIGSVVVFKDGQYALELPLLMNRSYAVDGATIEGYLTTTSLYNGASTTATSLAKIKERGDGSFSIAITGGNATVTGEGTGLTPQAIQGFVASGPFSMNVNGTKIAGSATVVAGDQIGPLGTQANMIEVVALSEPVASTMTEIIKLGEVSAAVYSGFMDGLSASAAAKERDSPATKAVLTDRELHHVLHAPKLASFAGMFAN
jgi:hypothetical protein